MLEVRLPEKLDNCRYRRNKEETAVPETPQCISDESKLIAEPRADLDGLAGPTSSERNAANVYAAYWQARSGLFPVPETDHSLHRPSGE